VDHAAELNDDNETVKEKFHALYIDILAYWFPSNKGYSVFPHWNFTDSTITNGQYITYVITPRRCPEHPLLLLEVKPPSDFHLDQKREVAITEITKWLDVIGPTNPHPRLYAISVVGKRWRVNYVTKGKGSRGGRPVKGIAMVNSLRSADQECWNPDITSDSSWGAFHSIANTIKSYATKQTT